MTAASTVPRWSLVKDCVVSAAIVTSADEIGWPNVGSTRITRTRPGATGSKERIPRLLHSSPGMPTGEATNPAKSAPVAVATTPSMVAASVVARNANATLGITAPWRSRATASRGTLVPLETHWIGVTMAQSASCERSGAPAHVPATQRSSVPQSASSWQSVGQQTRSRVQLLSAMQSASLSHSTRQQTWSGVDGS
ncbi:MAG: hypothetical protein H6730_34170 [Deltaproteobacteria bacterium]|nr:hypothetical protein [Deltaproteobacteria bacterium]